MPEESTVPDSRESKMRAALTDFRDSPSYGDIVRTAAANALMSIPGELEENAWRPNGRIGRMDAVLRDFALGARSLFYTADVRMKAQAAISHFFAGDVAEPCQTCGEPLNDLIHIATGARPL